jgi:hypothetical protein
MTDIVTDSLFALSGRMTPKPYVPLKEEDFLKNNQRGETLDSKRITPFHTYGDLVVNPHFQDIVNGGRGVTHYLNMPTQATVFHDEHHPWYEAVCAVDQSLQFDKGYSIMASRHYLVNMGMMFLNDLSKHIRTLLGFALLCLFMLWQTSVSNTQIQALQETIVMQNTQIEQERVALRTDAAREKSQSDQLTVQLATATTQNEWLRGQIGVLQTSQNDLKVFMVKQVADMNKMATYVDEDGKVIHLTRASIKSRSSMP